MQVNVKTFEYEKVIVHVEYRKLPQKEDLEEACIRFLKKAMQERGEKDNERE